jgi:hypothetical protein
VINFFVDPGEREVIDVLDAHIVRFSLVINNRIITLLLVTIDEDVWSKSNVLKSQGHKKYLRIRTLCSIIMQILKEK